ncbi:Omp28-related outer membrane protein [Winogradskyella sp.]|uniref:Omp28-related outer membrane protein n=1 Tax=Winogradskyella sp. TaxID=1883156 RepID=UPI0025F462F1|nr:Omp28-related outer membrane protein [Winogradskyella sp.]
MKKTLILKSLFFACILIFNSCGGDSNDGSGGDGGTEEITSITLSRQVNTEVYVGDIVFFNVKGNTNEDVTSSSTITLNGNDIGGSSYLTQTEGVLNFVATYNEFTSNTIQVTVVEPSVKFSKNVLIEDYTGTWCGYCPRVAYGIEQVEAATNNAIPVAIHRGNIDPNGSNHDPYNFSAGVLEDAINLEGYPTAMINRTTLWTYPEPSNISQVVNLTNSGADVGLALTPVLNGNTISLEVKMKFGELFFTDAKLIVYVLEDDLIYNQVNYTSYYGGSSVIANFEHDHVLRACLTDLLGDTIPPAEVVEDNEYTETFSVPVPSNVTDMSKMSIVAFVVNGVTSNVYNARSANFGDTQTIEEL